MGFGNRRALIGFAAATAVVIWLCVRHGVGAVLGPLAVIAWVCMVMAAPVLALRAILTGRKEFLGPAAFMGFVGFLLLSPLAAVGARAEGAGLIFWGPMLIGAGTVGYCIWTRNEGWRRGYAVFAVLLFGSLFYVMGSCAERAQPAMPSAAPPRSPWRDACREDAGKLCKGNDGSILWDCLRRQGPRLAASCRDCMDNAGKSWGLDLPGKRAACARDIGRLCEDIRPGDGRIERCLFRNWTRLSSECRRFD